MESFFRVGTCRSTLPYRHASRTYDDDASRRLRSRVSPRDGDGNDVRARDDVPAPRRGLRVGGDDGGEEEEGGAKDYGGGTVGTGETTGQTADGVLDHWTNVTH